VTFFWIADWLRAFGLTVAIELVIAMPFLAAAEPRLLRRAAGVALVNLASHPLVWFVGPALALPYAMRVGISETWAWLAEFGAYLVIWPALGARRAALVSACANGASFAVGLALQAFGLL
jgi:hypothetical protein